MNAPDRRSILTRAGLLAIAVASMALGGCQTAKVKEPLTATVGGNAPDQQLEFWHQLEDRPVTSYDEAFHAVLLFTEGNDPADNYAGRVTALKNKGLLAAGFDHPADDAIDRGTLAVALAKALQIKGGILMRTFSSSPRYAVRELQYLSVFPPSSPNQTFSGAELLGIMAKAEEYQHTNTRGTDTAVGSAQEPLRGSVTAPTTQEAGPAAPEAPAQDVAAPAPVTAPTTAPS
ncbi:MAG TPA: hypothetical protein VH722_00905, partial [Alphaproteobacteria bacterium]|nr:hypothetical protein [Alphaproteobacteria bacterium]